MLRYACLRLGLLVPVLLAASLIVFVLGRLARRQGRNGRGGTRRRR